MLEKLQINIEYNLYEDRLLVRISAKEMQGTYAEYRLWLTRRFAGVFLNATDKIVELGLAGDVQVSPDALLAMKKFQEESALAKADFSTAYELDTENDALMGERPFLVAKLNVRKKPDSRYVLSFLTNENEGINIAADIDLIYSLRKMLLESVGKAEWNQPVFLVKSFVEKTQ